MKISSALRKDVEAKRILINVEGGRGGEPGPVGERRDGGAREIGSGDAHCDCGSAGNNGGPGTVGDPGKVEISGQPGRSFSFRTLPDKEI